MVCKMNENDLFYIYYPQIHFLAYLPSSCILSACMKKKTATPHSPASVIYQFYSNNSAMIRIRLDVCAGI